MGNCLITRKGTNKKLNIVNLGSNSVSYTYGANPGYDIHTFTRTVTINIADKIPNYSNLGLTKDNFMVGLNTIESSYGDSYANVTSVSHSYSNGILTVNLNCTSRYGGNYIVGFSAYCAYLG